MLVIVDYGLGNIRSVTSALNHLGIASVVSSDPSEIEKKSTRLILPGVGSFRVAMENIRKRELLAPLNEAVLGRKIPVLGICLGMQLLADYGVEGGGTEGLGWVPGRVEAFNFDDPSIKVPHVGFNAVQITDSPHSKSLYRGLGNATDFYFVHSYHFVAADEADVSGRCEYHGAFTASVGRNNIHGVQFHPEKSQSNGLRLLRNFVEV